MCRWWPVGLEKSLWGVCRDLVDMTDFLSTLCEAAGVSIPTELKPDGRSFLPQLQGRTGSPRSWIYSYWVPLRATQTGHVGSRGAVEQAFDHHFKLYSTGEFYDLDHDPDETSAIKVADLKGEAAGAASAREPRSTVFRTLGPRVSGAQDTSREEEKREEES